MRLDLETLARGRHADTALDKLPFKCTACGGRTFTVSIKSTVRSRHGPREARPRSLSALADASHDPRIDVPFLTAPFLRSPWRGAFGMLWNAGLAAMPILAGLPCQQRLVRANRWPAGYQDLNIHLQGLIRPPQNVVNRPIDRLPQSCRPAHASLPRWLL
jgi:hypothetical protein